MDVTTTGETEADTDAINHAVIDVGQIDRSALAERCVAGTPAGDGFFVAISAAARAAMDAHTFSTLEVEVGGVMLGHAYRIGERAFLLIDAIVPALAAEQRGANVTFTAETWTQIHTIIDRDHPGAAIVGWYHTHPNFGIFLSEMDVFIQRHFFDLPHQVAIVVDPVAKTEGCFVWRDGVPVRDVLHPEDGPPAEPYVEATIEPEPATPPESALAYARDEDRPGDDFVAAVRQRVADVEQTPTAFDGFCEKLVKVRQQFGSLDLRQQVALAGLLLIVLLIFGSLIILLVHGSPVRPPEPIRSEAASSPSGTQR